LLDLGIVSVNLHFGGIMSTASQLFTADDLWRMPKDGVRRELVEGEVQIMSPAGGEHCAVVARLSRRLGAHVEDEGLGVVLAGDPGFVLSRKPDTVLAPDVAFVQQSRIPPSGPPKTFWRGAPDLAVEVVSPGDTIKQVKHKAQVWLQYGVLMVWIVNPKRRTVTVYRPSRAATVLSGDDRLDGHDVVPEFSCSIAELFL
jgi:Uma2 family endonuclease